MRRVQFALALPRMPQGQAGLPLTVGRLGDLCGAEPRLWTGDHVRRVSFGGRGCALGVLFSRRSMTLCRSRSIEGGASDRPAALATSLVRECWGAYFAILTDPADGALHLMADPSGLLRVYRADLPEHHLLVSSPALIEQVTGSPPALSWPAVAAHLRRPELRCRATCLEGVSELSPGELISLSGPQVSRRAVWRAEDHLPGRRSMAFEEAAEELAATATAVMGSWADWLGPVAVAASGGVDSSLICAALSRGGKSFACATVSTSDPSGDERKHVQSLADHLGVPAVAEVYDPDGFDPHCTASAGLPRPARKSFLCVLDAALGRAARRLGARVILDGNAGDNLFCFLHSAAPVVDRLRVSGLGTGVWNTLLDMSRITGCAVPVMTKAVWRRFLRGNALVWPPDDRLLDAGCDATPLSPLRPWFDAPVGLHEGKRDHLALVMQAENYVHDLGYGLPRFSPLMSQPLLEFCLGVPTWLWCHGGINRSLARAAFSDVLPVQIVSRTSKAGPDSFIRTCFAANRHELRAMLLDGTLAGAGLIDRAAVERELELDAHAAGSMVYRVLDLAEAEAWARSWQR